MRAVTHILVLVVLLGIIIVGRLSPPPAAPEQINTSLIQLSQYDPALLAQASVPAARDPRGQTPFDKPDEAAEFFVAQRLEPGQSDLPLEHLYEKLQETRARERDMLAKGAKAPGGITTWNEIGPGNIGGRTRAIAIDPTNTSVMYASGVAGGVWKSTDAGASWQPTDDMMPNLAVCALAIDPTNTSVIYAGTGEGYYAASVFVRGMGIFKSTDAGASWTQLAGTVSGVPAGAFDYVNKVRISPNDPSRLYAATRFGVWRSTDAGQSWSVVLANPTYHAPGGVPVSRGSSVGCTDLALRSDRNPDALWAAFGSLDSDGLFRSDDGGDSWVQYSTPAHQGRMTIAIAPSDNDRVYLVMADNGSLYGWGRIASIYRSDNGSDFSSVLDLDHPFSPWLMSYVSIATGCIEYPYIPSQGWYDNTVAVDPLDPDKVWVGGINVYRSDNAGQTFGLAGYWQGSTLDPPPLNYIHPDQHLLLFDPNYDGLANQTLWVGNDGGLFRTRNARAATSQEECPSAPTPGPGPEIVWENMNNGYGVTQFYHGDAALLSDRFAGGTQDNGTNKVDALGALNSWDQVYGGDGGYVAIDPRDPDRFFVEIQGFPEIQVTTDGGATFTEATNGIIDTDGLFITPYAMDPGDPDVMWTGGSRPWRTMDGAVLWELAGPDLNGPAQISAVAIAPTDGNVVYLGFNNGYVARTINGLEPSPSWSVFTQGLVGAWVSSLAVDPADPDIAYATYSSYGSAHVLRTTDGGTSWGSIDGVAPTNIPDVPAHWVAIRPCNGQQLYVGTEIGIFVSDDGGATWQPNNTGLANTVVESLDFKNENTLVAFSHGRGAFVANLLPCGAVSAEDIPTPRASKLSAYPNPFNPRTTIRYSTRSAGPVHIAIHDVRGRRVRILVDEWRAAGNHDIAWDGRDQIGSSIASGVYFIRMEAAGEALNHKVVLAK